MSRRPYARPEIIPHTPDIGNRFGRSSECQVISEIDGIAVADLVSQYGSPLFVFSERRLRERIGQFRAAFAARYPRVRFAWSYKTNYLDAVCAIFHQEGWHAEVVSELEYEMARRLGVPGAQIICNGAYKPRSWCARAVAEGALIQLDHFDEIETLEQVVAQQDEPLAVGLRLNMRLETLGVMWERFGFNLENGEALEAALHIAASPQLRLTGVHCHLGTFITLPDAYREATRKLARFAQDAAQITGRELDFINLGGGFPSSNSLLLNAVGAEVEAPEIERFADAICDELQEAFPRAALPELILESGRALVDDAGSLLATVVGTRRLASGERGLVLDAGLNLLYTAHWYRHRALPTQPVGGALENTTLHGPLCMNIDTLRRTLPLPPLATGHHVIIYPAGAYNVTQWMQFSQLRPAVVMIAGDGTAEVIRARETLEDVKGPERLPARYAANGKPSRPDSREQSGE